MKKQPYTKITKSNRQVIVDYIVSFLKKGETRGTILTKTVKKWQMSDRAFDRLLKIAKEHHSAEQEELKKELAEVDKAAAIDARKKAILTADERKELLSKIAKGEIEIPKSEIKWNYELKQFEAIGLVELASHSARISAIAELNKMDGDYAPTKVARTDSEGNDIDYSKIPDEVLDLIISAKVE